MSKAMKLSSAPPRAHHYARLLLDAWNSADSAKISHAIEEIGSAPVSPRPAELERMELIQEVGRLMRKCMAGAGASSDLRAGLDLLRHLAIPKSA